MDVKGIIEVFAVIVALEGVTVAVSSTHTSDIIKAAGSSFSGALGSAMGQYA